MRARVESTDTEERKNFFQEEESQTCARNMIFEPRRVLPFRDIVALRIAYVARVCPGNTLRRLNNRSGRRRGK